MHDTSKAEKDYNTKVNVKIVGSSLFGLMRMRIYIPDSGGDYFTIRGIAILGFYIGISVPSFISRLMSNKRSQNQSKKKSDQ